MHLTLNEITAIINGELFNNEKETLVIGGSIDSRTISPGELFFALPGERMDGHDYVKQALEAGAAAAVVTRKIDDGPHIIVSDVREALQRLAAFNRSRFDIPVIAVTGSVGKTTTKDLLATCLEGTFRTLKTSGNYNNELGLPLTLLKLTKEHEACVLELGMSAPGEIDLLAQISAPTIAVIVNAEAVHLESMKSIANIAKAKCEVLGHTRDFAVVNGDSAELRRECQTDLQVYWFGSGANCEWKIVKTQYNEPGTDITIAAGHEEVMVHLPIPAMHLAYNVCAAVGTSMLLGVPVPAIAGRLRQFSSSARRMKIKSGLQGTTIIDDCYNANPQSMAGALRVLNAVAGSRRKIAVLGDMFELGNYEEEGHRLVGKTALQEEVSVLVAIGEKAKYIVEGAKEGKGIDLVTRFSNREEALKFLLENIRPDDVILIKASRGMKLEEIVDALMLQEELM